MPTEFPAIREPFNVPFQSAEIQPPDFPARSDRFEGELDSVFAMQDRVAAHVNAAISPALHTYEVRRSERKPTENLTAYVFFLRALPANQKSLSRNEEALRYLYKAIDLDPSYGAAYGLGAWCYTQAKLFGWLAPTDARLKEGVRFAIRRRKPARTIRKRYGWPAMP